jgi:hypothetical protein
MYVVEDSNTVCVRHYTKKKSFVSDMMKSAFSLVSSHHTLMFNAMINIKIYRRKCGRGAIKSRIEEGYLFIFSHM